MRFFALILLLFAGAAASGHASRPEPKPFDFGFIASRQKDVHGEWHTKALGPFYESAISTQEMTFSAFRPFFSRIEDPPHDRTAKDYLWPIATSRSLNDESNWRTVIFFGYRHTTNDVAKRYRLWLFPFYFEGRDGKGATYRAVFPFGGSLHDFLGRDEIRFVLFPIRSTSRLNDLETSNWLWPIVSKTTGGDVYRRRVFPFYGVSRKDGRFERKFILWPFWTQARFTHPKSSGSGFILFPIVGHMKLTDQETWWVIPPLFRHTRGEEMDRTLAPWPFIQYARAPGRSSGKPAQDEKLYLWPLWGHRHVGNHDVTFWIWPLIWQHEVERVGETQHRFRVAPFFLNERTERPPGETRARYQRFWPLYSYRRIEEESRFRVLELWPFAETGGIERNWAPFWTLYSRMRSGEAVDSELLWGLYRNQKRGDAARYWSLFPIVDWRRDDEAGHLRRWNLLKGLIGFERDDSRAFLRLLYFLKFGDTEGDEP